MGVRNKQIVIEYQEFDSIIDMVKEEREYVLQAIKASERAYSPSSKFNVGALVVFDDGETIEGNNQENDAYPSGLCAERVALFYAKSKYPDKKISHVIVVGSMKGAESYEPVTPCAACRQVMVETEKRNKEEIIFIMASTKGEILRVVGVESLVPFTFILEEDHLNHKHD